MGADVLGTGLKNDSNLQNKYIAIVLGIISQRKQKVKELIPIIITYRPCVDLFLAALIFSIA